MPQLNGDGNVLLTDDIIAKEALRLLKNNLVQARLVSKRYQAEFADVGDTINIQMPARSRSAEGRALVIDPMIKQTVPLTIDRHRHVGMKITLRDRTLSLGDFAEQKLRSAVATLANDVDLSVGKAILEGGFYSSGTPGTPFTEESIIYAGAKAEMTGMPRDGMVKAVLNPLDAAAISIRVKGLDNPELVKRSLQKGYLDIIDDVALYRSANVPTHQIGPLGGTPLINGGGQSGSILITDGWTAAAGLRLRKGDVFTIAGVNSVNPMSYEDTGFPMQFVVTGDVVSNGAGAATVPISPAINDGNQFAVDAAGQGQSTAAYKNVTALPADNAAITVQGTANERYRYSALFHRDAVALAAPPLSHAETATVSKVVSDPDTGISLRLTAGYDVHNADEIYRIDVIWGVRAIYPELIHRIISATVAQMG